MKKINDVKKGEILKCKKKKERKGKNEEDR